jgi:aquaporin Z
MVKFLTEGIGSLLLVLAIGLTADPIAGGLMLTILLYIGYSFTDIHLNPAVSFGVWTLGFDHSIELAQRLIGQFSGALAGAFLTNWIALIPLTPGPATDISIGMFIVLVLIFSFLFSLLFLLMTYPPSKRARSVFGLVIGAGFTACLMVIEPLVGFGIQPALNTGFSILDNMMGGAAISHLPVYLFTPLVAGILAALLHKKLVQDDEMDIL